MDVKHNITMSSVQWFFISLLGITVILLAAYYFQFRAGYYPCPLCEMQRLVFVLIGFELLIAIFHRPHARGIRVYSIILFLLACLGNAFAIRQVWLQSLPANQIPSCGPNLNFMLRHLPPEDAIRQLFYGTADCAKVDWRFLHLSFAGWAIVFFSLLAVVGVWHVIAPRVKAK